MKTDPLADTLEKIASDLASAIADKRDVNMEHVTGFKALATYYISTRKLGKKQDDDGTDTFGDIKRLIDSASGGKANGSLGK